jgi:hypothetical protein
MSNLITLTGNCDFCGHLVRVEVKRHRAKQFQSANWVCRSEECEQKHLERLQRKVANDERN